MGALEHTIEYVQSREAFNAPLASNQLIQGETSRLVHGKDELAVFQIY